MTLMPAFCKSILYIFLSQVTLITNYTSLPTSNKPTVTVSQHLDSNIISMCLLMLTDYSTGIWRII